MIEESGILQDYTQSSPNILGVKEEFKIMSIGQTTYLTS